MKFILERYLSRCGHLKFLLSSFPRLRAAGCGFLDQLWRQTIVLLSVGYTLPRLGSSRSIYFFRVNHIVMFRENVTFKQL